MKKTIIREYSLYNTDSKHKGICTLAFLTDIHNCLSQAEQKQLFCLLDQTKPDLVLVGGDVLVGKKGKTVTLAAEFMEKLSEKYSVIYANGNHEQRIRLCPEEYGDMSETYEALIANTKVMRAVNRTIECEVRGIPLTIYGLEPELKFYHKGHKPYGMMEVLEQTFSDRLRGRYEILLAHNPRFWREYLEWGANLTLCGHYHGGMMLLGSHRGLISPDYRLLNADCCGMRGQGERHVIVSAGLGEHTIPFRIHNPRELTLVRLYFA